MRPTSPTSGSPSKNYNKGHYIRSTLDVHSHHSPYRINAPKSPPSHNPNNHSTALPTTNPLFSHSVPNLQKHNTSDHIITSQQANHT